MWILFFNFKIIFKVSQFYNIRNFVYLYYVELCLISDTYISIAPCWVDFMFLPLGVIRHSAQQRSILGSKTTTNTKSIDRCGYNRRQIQAMSDDISTWWVMKLKAIRCTHTLLGHLDSVSRAFQYNVLTKVNISPYKCRYV